VRRNIFGPDVDADEIFIALLIVDFERSAAFDLNKQKATEKLVPMPQKNYPIDGIVVLGIDILPIAFQPPLDFSRN